MNEPKTKAGAIEGETTTYTFADEAAVLNATYAIDQQLSAKKFALSAMLMSNTKLYTIFSEDVPVATITYDMGTTPQSITLNAGTSRHSSLIQSIFEHAASDCGGQLHNPRKR